ncbi:hypothetical protein BDV23DRAFT_196287 [Aspergillus alliaceus]|uniref:Rhodopsin domain-containing protein n=1 Tax=Petromyces alliaceus TaxID=209559 RepID=A0A5N7BXV2_PETAA|nr:hypothetical protein BDV23DRAFT_196287 [Aspergillus alliaceus]
MDSAPNQQIPLPPDHRSTAGLLAEYYILAVIALALVALRAWVRLHLTKNWGWDDTCIVIAWMALLAGLVTIQLECNLGMGRHVIYLKDPVRDVLQMVKINTMYQMINVICALVTKYSISLYILRIRSNRAIRWALAWLMFFMTLATIGAVVILAVACIPLYKLWTPEAPGICLPPKSVYGVAYIHSGFTIVVDLCLTSAPVIILWDVKIKRGRKTLICGLLSLGLIATISNALRNVYTESLTAPDMPYAITNIAIVSILEVNIGIIAACIPACVPAFRPKKEKPAPVTNSFHDAKVSGNKKSGSKWSNHEEGTSSLSYADLTSDTVALCEVKTPANVVTKAV